MSCNHCGDCCRKNGNMWRQSPHEMMRRLKAISVETEGPCVMWSKTDGCMIQKYLGDEAKPKGCKDYYCDEAKRAVET